MSKHKPNPGFIAFQELKKHIATKIGIPNGVGAAGAALRVIKEKNPKINSIIACKEAIIEFDKNVEKYRKFAL